MNTQTENKGFEAAKQVAFLQAKGTLRRASLDGEPINFKGYQDNAGRFWVIGDTEADLPGTSLKLGGVHPAVEVFPEPGQRVELN